MLTKVSVVLLIGVAIGYPNPDPVSKTTSQHSVHLSTVTAPFGEVKGSTIISRLGKTIYSFRGLRYAKAPVKELRFKPPASLEKWDGLTNATSDGAICPQPNKQSSEMSEDCLFLNVYTTKIPKGNDNPKRPVMVFFHQGEFNSYSGRSTDLGPQYLLDQDIVLVVPNYRLGVLGFLSTGEKEAPGNNGLKDQVEALKWVKENIAGFGGNPDSVTIAGYCAGGASVSLHLVSPLSKGLFHRAIVMSGSVYGNYPLVSNQLNLAKKVAKLVNCQDDTSSANIIQCLKTKTAEELANSISGLKEFGNEPIMQWGPVIEPDFGQPRFLPAHPIELLNRGKLDVPVLVGVTADEFGGRAFDVVANETLLSELDKEFQKYGPIAFMYERDSENSKVISNALKTFYFGDESIDKTALSALAQLFSDALVGFNVNQFVEALAQNNDQVYYYNFNYKGRYSFFYLPDSNNTSPYGASHLDDLIYLFHFPKFPLFKESDSEASMVEKMTKLWSNFVIHGVPIKEPCDLLDNVKWDAYTSKIHSYMDIGNKLVLSDNLLQKRYDEWRKHYPLSKAVKTG